MNFPWLSLTLLGIGSVVSLICGIFVLYVAFQKNPLWVFGCIFIPFCSLIFVIIHWADVKAAFLGQLFGVAVISIGLLTTPTFGATFWKKYNEAVAIRAGKAPTEDLNTQIQKHREQLESQQALFAQDGVELTKQYQALDAQRKALKPEDTAAITKFNEAAAAYQRKNVERKQMQAQIDSTQKELDGLLEARSRSAATNNPSSKKVVMYTTSHCPACKAAKQYFAQKGVQYEEIDVEASRSGYEAFQKLGGHGVPLIMVGDKRLDGFSAAALDTML